MSPEAPRKLVEGGQFYLDQDEDVRRFAARYGMSSEEVVSIILQPAVWAKRLSTGADPESVYNDVTETITRLQEAHGPTEDWDLMRVVAAHGLTIVGEINLAATLLADAGDISYTADYFAYFISGQLGSPSGRMGLEVIENLQDELVERGYSPDTLSRVFASLIAAATDRREPDSEYNPTPRPTTRERYHRASWEEIDTIVAQADYWPQSSTTESRQAAAASFAAQQHSMLSGDKVERKEVEALKILLSEGREPAEAWDRLRFIAAMSLYRVGEPRFGLGVIRAMDDPAIMGAASHALIMDGREREALEAAREIPDGAVFARTLHLGEWRDRTPIDSLLTDMTVADKINARRYDPDFRIAVAEGLQAVHAETGDEETALRMGKRADLLRTQKDIKFITAPKKR
jgi:hypothetical protein